MEHSNKRCHSQHTHHHGKHTRGPSSFRMHDSVWVFREISLKEGECFLDLGCGPGEYALYAANIVGATGSVYALDRSEQMIDGLRKKADLQGLKNIKAMHADITGAFPIEDRCVDVCFLATVLHTFDPAKDGNTLFNEISRVLKTGGQIAIIECKKEKQTFGPPEHMRLSPKEMEETLTQYGFETINVVDLGNNYLIRFEVKKIEIASQLQNF